MGCHTDRGRGDIDDVMCPSESHTMNCYLTILWWHWRHCGMTFEVVEMTIDGYLMPNSAVLIHNSHIVCQSAWPVWCPLASLFPAKLTTTIMYIMSPDNCMCSCNTVDADGSIMRVPDNLHSNHGSTFFYISDIIQCLQHVAHAICTLYSVRSEWIIFLTIFIHSLYVFTNILLLEL